MASEVTTTCNSLLQNIRSSGLNFSFQETPLSVYVTLRKSFFKPKPNQPSPPEGVDVTKTSTEIKSETCWKFQFEQLMAKYKELDKAYSDMKNEFEEAIDDCGDKNKIIDDLRRSSNYRSKEVEEMQAKCNTFEIEKKNLETKIVTLATENKSLKKEIVDVKTKVKEADKELKSLKKENKGIEHDFVRKVEALEGKVTTLQKYKSAKAAEENAFEKKIKAVKEREARVEIEKMEFERKIYLKKTKLVTKICQTDQHPDLPYKITSPLPPIFGSQLLHHTPPIKFLSRSLPSLNKICWSQPNEDPYLDEAEEYLNWQYDQKVKQFYIDAKQTAEDKRKVLVNNNVEE